LEEELTLVDPASMLPVALAPGLVRYLRDAKRFRLELSPTQIEIVSQTRPTAADATADLGSGRADVIAALNGQARLAGLGAHPFGETSCAVSPGDGYAELQRTYRWAIHRAGLAGGLHVHLGIPGADRLLAVYNRLRGHIPEIAALAASAPFFDGRDTGLASIRPLLADSLPRQGVAPAFASWDEYAELLSWGASTGAFGTHHRLWWECRLHRDLGTIEVRAPDAQSAIEDVETLATVVHCTGRWLASAHDRGEDGPVHPVLAISENRWRAATDGVDGEMIDLDRHRPVLARRLIGRLLDRAEEVAGSPGEHAAIARARAWLAHPHPRRQRELAARGRLEGLVAELADATEQVAYPEAVPETS
jgi:glutamate---cysteine ligase / carboxylate-amine ligase